MQSFWFNSGKRLLCSAGWDWEKDKLRAVLVDESFAPDTDTTAITGEIEAKNYEQGGVFLENIRVEEKLNEQHLYADPIVIPKTTLSSAAVVVVHDKTSTLLLYLYAGKQESYRSDFEIEFGEDGVCWV